MAEAIDVGNLRFWVSTEPGQGRLSFSIGTSHPDDAGKPLSAEESEECARLLQRIEARARSENIEISQTTFHGRPALHFPENECDQIQQIAEEVLEPESMRSEKHFHIGGSGMPPQGRINATVTSARSDLNHAYLLIGMINDDFPGEERDQHQGARYLAPLHPLMQELKQLLPQELKQYEEVPNYYYMNFEKIPVQERNGLLQRVEQALESLETKYEGQMMFEPPQRVTRQQAEEAAAQVLATHVETPADSRLKRQLREALQPYHIVSADTGMEDAEGLLTSLCELVSDNQPPTRKRIFSVLNDFSIADNAGELAMAEAGNRIDEILRAHRASGPDGPQ